MAGRPVRRDEESPSQESGRGWTGETQEGGGQGFQHVLPSVWLVCAAHLSSSVVLLSLFSACLPRLVSQLNDEQGPGRMYWVLPRCPSLR